MSQSDDDSFVILGSTPSPSLNGYIDALDAGRQSSLCSPEPATTVTSLATATAAAADVAPQQPASVVLVEKNPGVLTAAYSGGAAPKPRTRMPTSSMPSLSATPVDSFSIDALSATLSSSLTLKPTSGNSSSSVRLNVGPGEQPLVERLADAMLDTRDSFQSAAGSVGEFRIPERSGAQLLRSEEHAAHLESSIVEYFPSMCSEATSKEDMQRLGSLVCEHLELKENLEKTNNAIQQHFVVIAQWQSRLQKFKETKQLEVDEHRAEIQKLQEEVLALNTELVDKSKHFDMTCLMMRQENTELVQQVSHQKSMIMNMSNQISQMQSSQSRENMSLTKQAEDASRAISIGELQETIAVLNAQLSQLEDIKRGHEQENEALSEKFDESQRTIESLNKQLTSSQAQKAELESLRNMVIDQNICALDRQEVIDSLNEQLKGMAEKSRECASLGKMVIEQTGRADLLQSNLQSVNDQLSLYMAENLETQDMKQVFMDQIKCLEANVATADRRLKRKDETIGNLLSKIEELATKDETIAAQQSRLDVLAAQLDVYKEDFLAERMSRQDLARERDVLLADMKMLQRRNEQLASMLPPGEAAASATNNMTIFSCPLCEREFPKLKLLETHVNQCC